MLRPECRQTHQMSPFARFYILLLLPIFAIQTLCNAHGGHRSTRQLKHIFSSGVQHTEILAWAVKVISSDESNSAHFNDAADIIARDTGLVNHGQIGALEGYFLLAHPVDASQLPLLSRSSGSPSEAGSGILSGCKNLTSSSTSRDVLRDETHRLLDVHPLVEWHHQQRISPRSKRNILPAVPPKLLSPSSSNLEVSRHLNPRAAEFVPYSDISYDDPLFRHQWHLVNTLKRGMDINVSGVWLHNVTGRGVTVAVIDDGLEWSNPDLLANYNPDGSFDLNSGDDDPMPDTAKATNHHGTRCGGEIAAVANNQICGIGVAYGARLSGIRILDGPMTDVLEAAAFSKKYDINDIYSCSWGPEDDGKTVDGPQHVAITGLRHGVDYGRRGYGAVFVVASGNGGTVGDNCNYDGYANVVYTVTVGAVDEDGRMPYYGEECASMLAVTFSSGSTGRNIVTTDWTKVGGTGCTESHSGTSAAAPLAAAMIALMLEARPCLTWRDIQHIIVLSAVKIDPDVTQWTRNSAGLYHSHQHGFGLMNAWRLVNAAKVWTTVPWMTVFTSREVDADLEIPGAGRPVESKLFVSLDDLSGYSLSTLEYVHVTVTLSHERRGDVHIVLFCPSGTASLIGATRKLDESNEGFKEWTFSTVRCWGEAPTGNWTVIVSDAGGKPQSRGKLERWNLKLFGSPMTSDEIQQRIRLVNEASSGKYLHADYQLPCPPPPMDADTNPNQPISDKILKIVALTSIFALILALYETFEYAFCYDDEKRQMYREWLLLRRQHTEASSAAAASESAPNESSVLLRDGAAADSEDVASGGVAMEMFTFRSSNGCGYAPIIDVDAMTLLDENFSSAVDRTNIAETVLREQNDGDEPEDDDELVRDREPLISSFQ